MKHPAFAIAALSLALAAPAWAENSGPAMKAETGMKMENHDKMSGGMAMSGTAKADKMAMKPMAMKAGKKPKDAMKSDMPMSSDMKDMKH